MHIFILPYQLFYSLSYCSVWWDWLVSLSEDGTTAAVKSRFPVLGPWVLLYQSKHYMYALIFKSWYINEMDNFKWKYLEQIMDVGYDKMVTLLYASIVQLHCNWLVMATKCCLLLLPFDNYCIQSKSRLGPSFCWNSDK